MLARLLALVVFVPAQVFGQNFAETAQKDFDSWDTDHDGAVSFTEVNAAVLSPGFHGEDAAAIAALFGYMYSAKSENPPVITKEWLGNTHPVPLRIAKGTPAAEVKKARKEYMASPGSLQSSFASCLRRLSRTHSVDLYEEGGPNLSDIRQGALGDCFMLAPLGALVKRNPDDVKSMIQREDNGYSVRFSDGNVVHVAPLTDAELALGGSGTSRGLWIRIMEKAYGSRRFSDGEVRVVRDGMNGGSSGTAGRVLTGHKFTSVPLVGDYKKQVAEDLLQQKMQGLRDALPAALNDKRLVIASTTSREMPRSISPNHAYAVLSFDPEMDLLTIWNPHGTDFKPKGEDSLENGYARDDGVFTMPLEPFVRTFGRVFFESKDDSPYVRHLVH